MVTKQVRAIEVPWLSTLRKTTPFEVPVGAQVIGVEGTGNRFFVFICEDVQP